MSCSEPDENKVKNNDPLKPRCINDDAQTESCSGAEYVFYKDVPPPDDLTIRMQGLGIGYNCDPMQAGHIVNNQHTSPTHIYPYAQGIRAVDEAMMDLFSNTMVRDDLGKMHKVPIVWGGQEAAIAAVLRSNVRKDNTMVTDRIRLPIMAINNESYSLNKSNYIYHKAINYRRGQDGKPGNTISERWERDTVLGFARGIPVNLGYTLTVWTQYQTDIKQIVEQLFMKFSPVAYIRLRGVTDAENIVELESVSSNEDRETEAGSKRVIKMQLGMTVQTYIPQPIERKKAVLSTKIDVVDSINEEEIISIIARLEEAVKFK